MFLLVPAQPGCPGQSPESRKVVVLVVLPVVNTLVEWQEGIRPVKN